MRRFAFGGGTFVCAAWLAFGCTTSGSARPPARWIATIDHGDKPGVAYELWVEGDTVVRGVVSIVDPALWEGGTELAGIVRVVAPMERVVVEGTSLSFRVPENHLGGLPESGVIELAAPLVGRRGDRVAASVTLMIAPAARAPWFDAGPVELELERVE